MTNATLAIFLSLTHAQAPSQAPSPGQSAAVLNPTSVAVDECAQIESRVTDLAGRWLASLPVQARMKAVAEFLGDEVGAVRLAAVIEIERMLRDGVRPDNALTERAAEMLGDSDPRVRMRAGRLVIDMGLTFASDGLSARLERERDDGVIDGWLDALLLAPTASAFSPASARIEDAVHGERAARLLCELVRLGSAPIDWKKRLAPALRIVADNRPTPSIALLVAQLGDEEDIVRAARLLESSDAAVRRGAAEGFLRAGDSARVLTRASDPAIAAIVIAAIANERPTPAGFRELVDFPISGELREQLHERIAEVAAKLSAAELFAAAELLATARSIDARVRLRILEAGARRFTGGEDAASAAVIARLASELIAVGRRGDAVTRLEGAHPQPGTTLADALFLARLSAGRFDDAARQDPLPSRWVAAAETLARTGDESARALVDEMTLRLGARLSDDERRRLASVEAVLASAPARANDR